MNETDRIDTNENPTIAGDVNLYEPEISINIMYLLSTRELNDMWKY